MGLFGVILVLPFCLIDLYLLACLILFAFDVMFGFICVRLLPFEVVNSNVAL